MFVSGRGDTALRALRILLRWPIRGWLHRRCLKRIALLERELGIWPPYELEAKPRYDGITADFEFKPGAVWPIESTNFVQIFRSNLESTLLYGKTDWLEDGFETVEHRH